MTEYLTELMSSKYRPFKETKIKHTKKSNIVHEYLMEQIKYKSSKMWYPAISVLICS